MEKILVLITAALITSTAFAQSGGEPIVFIHGFKGGQLLDENNHVRWVTPLQSLGLGSETIDLPEEWEKDGSQQRDTLKPGEVLQNLFLIPVLVGDKIYGPWLDWLKSFGLKNHRPVYTFTYDWRRDNNETSKLFEKFLDAINGGKKNSVDVIAHSMGGLLTLSVLNRRFDIFKRLIFAGVPFEGGIGFLEDMHAGSSTGINSKIASPEVIFTFPSVYTLFSESGQGVLDKSGKEIAVDFYSPETWYSNHLGVFSLPHRDLEKDKSFLVQALHRAKEFRKSLHVPKNKYPPLQIILGHNTPTICCAMKDGPKSIRGWDFKSAQKISGDGRVAATNLPPQGVKYDLFYSEYEHSHLLNDPKVIEVIEKALLTPSH
jgi:pimeloyl-ACP methyl ester carboxylesterase